ncbi:MAG: poly-beta-1,6-N-acetyl-D-glucosamine biosynthesis protein PgaD [Pseudomonadota bacterium]
MKNPLIIEKPELQSAMHRYGWGLVTFAFWSIYVYLWLPLITLLAWWAGVYLFNIHMVKLQGYDGLLSKLALYSFVIVSLSALLIGWANIERLRFQGVKRRLGRAEISAGQVAHHYKLQESHLVEFRQKKSLEVHFSDEGHIAKIIEYVCKHKA